MNGDCVRFVCGAVYRKYDATIWLLPLLATATMLTTMWLTEHALRDAVRGGDATLAALLASQTRPQLHPLVIEATVQLIEANVRQGAAAMRALRVDGDPVRWAMAPAARQRWFFAATAGGGGGTIAAHAEFAAAVDALRNASASGPEAPPLIFTCANWHHRERNVTRRLGVGGHRQAYAVHIAHYAYNANITISGENIAGNVNQMRHMWRPHAAQ